MKNYIVIFFVLFLVVPSYAEPEDFLGAPLVAEGDVIIKTDARLEVKVPMSHDEIVALYKEALKDFSDIKYRDWEDSTYIEDDGKLSWHSITISKDSKNGTTIIIVKDNWTWIIGTLILRYIGVFAVLMTLFLGMALSGKIISSSVDKLETKKA